MPLTPARLLPPFLDQNSRVGSRLGGTRGQCGYLLFGRAGLDAGSAALRQLGLNGSTAGAEGCNDLTGDTFDLKLGILACFNLIAELERQQILKAEGV